MLQLNQILSFNCPVDSWFLIGLPPAAISLVFKAFYGFAVKLDTMGVFLALMSCLVAILINNGEPLIDPMTSQWVFPSTLALGAFITFVDSKRAKPFASYGSPSSGWEAEGDETFKRIGIPLWVGVLILFTWAAVLAVVLVLVKRFDYENVYLELLQVAERDLLRRELLFKLRLDLLQAGVSVQHAEDGVFFFVEAIIIQPDGFLDDPKRAAVIALLASREVRSHPQRQSTRRAANEAVRERCHEPVFPLG